jgi:large subunit ribosomal protein L29
MNANEIRELSAAELDLQLHDATKRIWKIRFQAATGQTEELGKVHSLRRDVARMKTILRERELNKSDAGE